MYSLLLEDTDRPRPDYTAPVEKDFLDFTRYCIWAGTGGAVLRVAGMTAPDNPIISGTKDTSKGLPTWCSDWRTKSHLGCNHSSRPATHLDFGHHVSITINDEGHRFVTVRGLSLSKIVEPDPVFKLGESGNFRDGYFRWFSASQQVLNNVLASGRRASPSEINYGLGYSSAGNLKRRTRRAG